MNNTSASLDLLISTAQKIELSEQIMDKLIDTVMERLQAVVDAKGFYTKYQGTKWKPYS